jgi:hypothetical protein
MQTVDDRGAVPGSALGLEAPKPVFHVSPIPSLPSMTDEDLEKILEGVDLALNVYRKSENNLGAPDTRLKGMLLAVRLAVEDQLTRDLITAKASAKGGGKIELIP